MLYHLRIGLRLYYRNTMALIYGYLFPAIYFAAFWVLYRYERAPMLRHMGELLTISVLAGACFGLPTTLVSERERGVWRRYRLAPLPTRDFVLSTVAARYLILLTAGVLQFALAASIGTPMPKHPIELWVAYSCVAFAFLGLGLVIAMLADNVPAVQALGQCIFLPMLIIGGVAVQLASLPPWAQHLAAFFPGRYAVETIQACVTGKGLSATRFSVLALILIGAAGCVAGAKMFRWDAQQRFIARGGKGWLAVALSAWIAVGLLAEWRGRIAPVPAEPATDTKRGAPQSQPAWTLATHETAAEKAAQARAVPATQQAVSGRAAPDRGHETVKTPPPVVAPPPRSAETPPANLDIVLPSGAKSWQGVTIKDIEETLVPFNRLPPDGGVVTPIAASYEEPDADVATELQAIAERLPVWKPGKVEDPVQRVRNYLYVMAVPDVFQAPSERYVPLLVFDQLQQAVPKDDLIKILFWIAIHPEEGDDSAMDDLRSVGLTNGPTDVGEARNRAAIYGLKLLGRLLGKITPK